MVRSRTENIFHAHFSMLIVKKAHYDCEYTACHLSFQHIKTTATFMLFTSNQWCMQKIFEGTTKPRILANNQLCFCPLLFIFESAENTACNRKTHSASNLKS